MALEEMYKEHELYDELQFHYEEHYNHYGTRGVADMYVQEFENSYRRDSLHEVKSDSAIRNATGANEILRQFKRMAKYFLAGSDFDYPPRGSITPNAELTFVATEAAFEHVKENYQIYKSIDGETIDTPAGSVECGVTLRSLKNVRTPFIAFHDKFGLKADTFNVSNNRTVVDSAGIGRSVVEE